MSNESKILSHYEVKQALLAFMDCVRDGYDPHNTDSKQMEAKRRLQELRQQIENHDTALRSQRDALLAMVEDLIRWDATTRHELDGKLMVNDKAMAGAARRICGQARTLIARIKGE